MTEFNSMQEAFDHLKAKYDRKRSLGHNRFTDGVLDLTISENDLSNSMVDDSGSSDDNIVSTNYAGIPFIGTAKENKGVFDKDSYDEYSNVDPEPLADKILEANGATITYSGITITDSQGRNRTVVKKISD